MEAYLAFGGDWQHALTDPAASEQLSRAIAEAITRITLEVAKKDPLSWLRYIAPETRQEGAKLSPAFADFNVLNHPAVAHLVVSLSEWASKHLSKELYEQFREIVRAARDQAGQA